MTEELQFATSKEFWESLDKFPMNIKGKILDVWNRMHKNPWDMNLHAEKVKSTLDDRIWSCRVDDNYRLIWAHISVRGKPDYIILLYVDKHDPSYDKAKDRAKNLKFKIENGMVKIIEVIGSEKEEVTNITYENSTKKPEIGKLFIGYRDQELLDYGVPKDLLMHVRRLDNEDELDKIKGLLSEDVYNNLIALALGDPSLAQVSNDQIHRSIEKYHGGDNLYLFVSSEEFKRALAGELEDWMLFLAPDQRRLVYADYNGPSRVKGVTGSGKTVVAIHRALHLARTIGSEGDILFLTYGNRLPGVVEHLLKKLAGENAPELKRIKCLTIHQLCYWILRENGDVINVATDNDKLWALITAINDIQPHFPKLKLWKMDSQFFIDEIQYSIKGRAISTFEQYAGLERSGRGSALSESERKAMWQVYLKYQHYLNQKGLWDYEDYILEALALIRSGKIRRYYRAAIVDEIQDLNAATMMLLRTIVKPASNDLFLVGDGLQKLYPGGYVLSNLGIDIVGRGTVLKRNYRNTQQILRAAYAMVKNNHFNDLDDEESVVEEPEYSPRNGELPVIKGFQKTEDEIEWVKQEITRLKQEKGLKDKDFAILYRWRSPYQELLSKILRYPVTEIKKDPETYFGSAIKISTFDSAKGLEFKVVFLVGVTDATKVPKDDLSLEGIALEEYLKHERSRLFVAMTRARDLLYITYSRGQISRFLNGIPDSYFSQK